MTTQTQRVLVTGAAGFSGHHMVLHAAKHGLAVRATDLSSRHYGPLFEELGVEFVASDLCSAGDLSALMDGVDGVFHFAGIHDYSTSDDVIFAINVHAVEKICAAAVDAGVEQLVHISSAGVYGYDWHGVGPVSEDAAKLTPPLNNYNVSKWRGEEVVRRIARDHDLRATILRPGAIYGPRSEYGLFNVFKQVHKERANKRMLMVGKGDCIEGFVHVDDVCRAVLHAYGNASMVGEVFNVADDSRLTTAEFFKLVCKELLGVDKELFHLPKAVLLPLAAASQQLARALGRKSLLEPATIHYLTCDRVWDNRKLKDTGFTFEYPTIHDGLGQTLRWYKDNGWL